MAAAAAEKAAQQGARFAMAAALYSEGWALQNLGQFRESMRVAEQSEQISRSLGDRTGVSRVLTLTGSALMSTGDVEGALKKYQAALSISRETGSKLGMSTSTNNIANVLLVRVDLSGARKMYEQAVSLFHEVGDKDYEGFALTNLSHGRVCGCKAIRRRDRGASNSRGGSRCAIPSVGSETSMAARFIYPTLRH